MERFLRHFRGLLADAFFHLVGFAQGIPTLGEFNLVGAFLRNFEHPLTTKLYVESETELRHENFTDLPYHRTKYGGLDFARRRRDFVFMRLNMEVVLIPLDRRGLQLCTNLVSTSLNGAITGCRS